MRPRRDPDGLADVERARRQLDDARLEFRASLFRANRRGTSWRAIRDYLGDTHEVGHTHEWARREAAKFEKWAEKEEARLDALPPVGANSLSAREQEERRRAAMWKRLRDLRGDEAEPTVEDGLASGHGRR